jgi:hypothetical protein
MILWLINPSGRARREIIDRILEMLARLSDDHEAIKRSDDETHPR